MSIQVYVKPKKDTTPVTDMLIETTRNVLTVKQGQYGFSWQPDEKLSVKDAVVVARELARDTGRFYGNLSKDSKAELDALAAAAGEITKATPLIDLVVVAKDGATIAPQFEMTPSKNTKKLRRDIGTIWVTQDGRYFFTIQKDLDPKSFAYAVSELKKGKESALYGNAYNRVEVNQMKAELATTTSEETPF